MLFLTVGTLLYSGLNWWAGVVRRQHYAQIMHRLLNRVSVLIQQNKPHQVGFLGNVMYVSSGRVDHEDEFIRITTLDHLQEVDMSLWSSFPPCSSKLRLASPDCSVLLQARLLESHAETMPCQISEQVLRLGFPIAWTRTDTYNVILQSDMPHVISLIDTFSQGQLTLCSDMEVFQLVMNVSHNVSSGQHKATSSEDLSRITQSSTLGTVSHEANTFHNASYNPATPRRCLTTAQPSDQANTNVSQNASYIPTSANENIARTAQLSNQESVSFSTINVSHNASYSTITPSRNLPRTTESMSHKTVSSHGGSCRQFPKPPNILVYCGIKDTARKFSQVKSSLESCINTEAYTVYHLGHERLLSAPWQDNVALLVVSFCPHLRKEAELVIQDYMNNRAGNLLSFSSSLDFLFAQHEEQSGMRGERLLTFQTHDSKFVTSLCDQYVYRNVEGSCEVLVPYLLDNENKKFNNKVTDVHDANGAADIECDRRGLVIKTSCAGGGMAVLSQLLLDHDPTEYAADQLTFDALKCSNSERLNILRQMLSSLDLDTSMGSVPALSPCYMVARRLGIQEILHKAIQHRLRPDGLLKALTLSLQFIQKSTAELTTATTSILPVVTHSDCDMETLFFDMSDYWRHLDTAKLGQILFYTDVITSTMTIFEGLLFSIPEEIGVIAIAGRQTGGRGRGGNVWLSPVGCAMFTLPLSLSLDTELGQRVSFLQHMVSLAVIHSVLTLPGYQDLNLRLKWPNDIYYSNHMKLGGVLVTSTVMGSTVYATIGCGFNVTNSNPTICINDIIHIHNVSHPDQPPLQPLTPGQLIARTLSALEDLIQLFEGKGHRAFCDIYYKYWLHGDTKVKIQLETNTEGLVTGLDSYGFLEVMTVEGKVISVQPDGNSFDMMHNLIHFKST